MPLPKLARAPIPLLVLLTCKRVEQVSSRNIVPELNDYTSHRSRFLAGRKPSSAVSTLRRVIPTLLLSLFFPFARKSTSHAGGTIQILGEGDSFDSTSRVETIGGANPASRFRARELRAYRADSRRGTPTYAKTFAATMQRHNGDYWAGIITEPGQPRRDEAKPRHVNGVCASATRVRLANAPLHARNYPLVVSALA